MTDRRRDQDLIGRNVLFDPFDGSPRGRGALTRITPGSAVVLTRARPPLGTTGRLRIYGTAYGELTLSSVVRWHDDDGIGLQLGALRARQMFALNRLTVGNVQSPRLRLRRQGFELDAVDVVALASGDTATMVLPPSRTRRLVVLWLRNARFDANLLELDAHHIVISAPVNLTVGTRVALSVRTRPVGEPVDVPARVSAVAAGRTTLAYEAARRHAA